MLKISVVFLKISLCIENNNFNNSGMFQTSTINILELKQ